MTKRMQLRAGLLAATAWIVVLAATAQAAPGDRIGNEFRVNDQTLGRQTVLAVLPSDDGFVVAYKGDGSPVYARRYDIHGFAQGSALLLNAGLYVSAVALQPQGGFVVAGTDTAGLLAPKVRVQRLDALGNPLGAVANVDGVGSTAVGVVKLASDAAGNFIVVWESEGQLYIPGPLSSPIDPLVDVTLGAIRGRLYNADGSARAASFRFGSSLGLYNFESFVRSPAVAMDEDGSFVVAWQQSLGQTSSVRVQRYSARGAALTLVTKLASGNSPAVALRNGNAAVAWQAFDAASSNDVYMQRLNVIGKPAGSALRVNSFLSSEQTLPSLAIDSTGNLVVAWQSGTGSVGSVGSAAGSQDGSGYGVFARRFPAGGNPGPEYPVNSYTDQHQYQPLLAAGNGRVLAAWTSGHLSNSGPPPQDGSKLGTYAQLFEGP